MQNTEKLKDEVLRDNEQIATYLNLSISLDPAIELPSENVLSYYPGAEIPQLLILGGDWVDMLRNKLKNRKIAAFGENLEGHSVLLCRYLEPMKPPAKLIDLDSNLQDKYAIEKAARFVSMIPFVQDLKMFKDLPDMYSTCQEFIDLGGGDYEEHAILLANYFNYIDEKQSPGKYYSYLIYGESLPEGRNTFVMRTFVNPKDGRDIEIWSPLSAECFFFRFCDDSESFCYVPLRKASHMEVRLNDPICPLKRVWFIVGKSNVWANIQKFDFPVLMNFELTDKSNWKPLFESENHMKKYYPLGIQSIQPPVTYADLMNPQQVLVLTSRIQKYLVEHFQDERIKAVRKTTKWVVTANEKL